MPNMDGPYAREGCFAASRHVLKKLQDNMLRCARCENRWFKMADGNWYNVIGYGTHV